MSEKRFQIDDDGDISEFENKEWVDCWEYGNGKHWDKLCDRLNSLYEDNQRLKKENNITNEIVIKAISDLIDLPSSRKFLLEEVLELLEVYSVDDMKEMVKEHMLHD